MHTDIVIPQNNESLLIKRAQFLGFKSIIFLYDKSTGKQALAEKLTKEHNFPCSIGTIVAGNKTANGLCVARACSDNRALLERKGINMIFELEDQGSKEFIHHRNSGLNHVLAKLACDNKIAVGLSVDLILRQSKKGSSIIMGRMKQNIMFCRKFKVLICMASFASNPNGMRGPKDIMSLAVCLGMHPSEMADISAQNNQ